MTDIETKAAIQSSLARFAQGNLVENALALLGTLGYRSDRRIDLQPNTAMSFQSEFDPSDRLNPATALLADWRSVDLLFQLTGDEITNPNQPRFEFDAQARVDNTIIQSYLFFAIGLGGEQFTVTRLWVD